MAPDRTPTPGPSPSSSTPGKSGCPHATWRSPPGPGTGPTWASTSYRSSAACRCPGSCPRPRSPARTPPPANAWSPSPTRRTTSRRRGLSPHPPQHRPVLTGRGHLEPEGVVRLERATELGRLVGREAVMRAVRQRKLCPELAPDGLGEFSAVARVPIDRHSLSSTRGTRPSGAPYAMTVRLVGDDLDATRWPAKRRRRVRAAQSRPEPPLRREPLTRDPQEMPLRRRGRARSCVLRLRPPAIGFRRYRPRPPALRHATTRHNRGGLLSPRGTRPAGVRNRRRRDRQPHWGWRSPLRPRSAAGR